MCFRVPASFSTGFPEQIHLLGEAGDDGVEVFLLIRVLDFSLHDRSSARFFAFKLINAVVKLAIGSRRPHRSRTEERIKRPSKAGK